MEFQDLVFNFGSEDFCGVFFLGISTSDFNLSHFDTCCYFDVSSQGVSSPFEFKFFDKTLNVEFIMFDSFPAASPNLEKEQFHLLGGDGILGKEGDHLFNNELGEISIIFVKNFVIGTFFICIFVKNVVFIF